MFEWRFRQDGTILGYLHEDGGMVSTAYVAVLLCLKGVYLKVQYTLLLHCILLSLIPLLFCR